MRRLTLVGEIGEQTISAAASVLRRPGVAFDPRRMWSSAMPGLGVDVRGKLPFADQAETRRVIARLTDLGFGAPLRSLLGADAVEAPVPEGFGQGLRSRARILGLGAASRRCRARGLRAATVLIAGLAARLADIGRLSDLGSVAHVGHGQSSAGRSNSALRLREVWNAYEVPSKLASQLTGQPVLLVDDFIDTGWTFTVVARLLRRAGAGQVYPFALALAA